MMWNTGNIKDGVTGGFDIKDFKEYTPGRQFVAKGSHEPHGPFGIRTNVPVFHFCNNAVDTLMWYWEVFDFMDWDKPTPAIQFFEIKPLDKIYRSRVNDETMLWQCGTNKFEIVRHTNLKNVAEDACKEILHDTAEIICRYSHYDMMDYIKKIQKQAGR